MNAAEIILASKLFSFAAFQAHVLATLPSIGAVEASVTQREQAISAETVKPGRFSH